MTPAIERQMRNFSVHDGDRIDPIAQALRRLFLRVELCPCGGLERKPTPCRQCQLDLESIEDAWNASAPPTP